LLNGYVEKFASHDFGFIFRPYFWLLAAIGLFIYALKRQAMKYRLAIVCLSLSAAIYILGYVPLVIGADYRYIYWSVIATCLAGLLAAVDRKKQKTA
jgi:biotin transporter BioY